MPKRFPCALQISPKPTREDIQKIKIVAWTHDMTKSATLKKLSKMFPRHDFFLVLWELKNGKKTMIKIDKEGKKT